MDRLQAERRRQVRDQQQVAQIVKNILALEAGTFDYTYFTDDPDISPYKKFAYREIFYSSLGYKLLALHQRGLINLNVLDSLNDHATPDCGSE